MHSGQLQGANVFFAILINYFGSHASGNLQQPEPDALGFSLAFFFFFAFLLFASFLFTVFLSAFSPCLYLSKR